MTIIIIVWLKSSLQKLKTSIMKFEQFCNGYLCISFCVYVSLYLCMSICMYLCVEFVSLCV